LNQSIIIPLVVMSDSREQSDRERVEFELLQDAVSEVNPSSGLAYTMECPTRGSDRQRRNDESLAVGRDGGDARCNTKADVPEQAQLLHHGVYFPSICSLRVEDGFGIVENYEHLL
jgi:hypothetical protein